MVLLHSSWKFNGLAGATTLLTIIIVISGFIGRYIYTQIPRTLEGVEIETPSGQFQAGRPGACPPIAGDLAHHPHPDRDGALHCRFYPYRRGIVLCNLATIGE